jgi:transcriptional regulator with XRE-family HTH domain
MAPADTLIPRIEEHCRATGTAESTFGRIAVNDGKLVRRLRAGGTVTLKTLQRIEDVLSAAHPIRRSTDQIVGSRIRLRRGQIGLSQARLAAMLGVSPQRMQEFEEGNTRVGAARLCAIAQALKAPVSFFFADLPPAESASSRIGGIGASPTLLSTPAAAQLLSAYGRIGSSQLRRVVLAVARHLARESPRRERRSPANSQAKRACSSKPHAH